VGNRHRGVYLVATQLRSIGRLVRFAGSIPAQVDSGIVHQDIQAPQCFYLLRCIRHCILPRHIDLNKVKVSESGPLEMLDDLLTSLSLRAPSSTMHPAPRSPRSLQLALTSACGVGSARRTHAGWYYFVSQKAPIHFCAD
jgi:hypothetical protein